MKVSNVYFVLLVVSVVLWAAIHGKKVTKRKQKVKIVNGVEIQPHSLPYMVALRTNIDEKSVFCGGSLIKPSLVLTAAKCVSGATEAEVTLGAHHIDKVEDTQITLTSTEFIIHPEYDSETHFHDIALILLPSEVTLDENVATVKIPELGDINTSYNELEGLVSGWGKTKDTDTKISDVLNGANVTIIPTLACEIPYFLSISFDQMCTSGVSKKNICFGDTGSPLVVDGVQVAVASFGSDFGCEVGLPGVFTRITSHLRWLLSNIDTYA